MCLKGKGSLEIMLTRLCGSEENRQMLIGDGEGLE